MTIAQFRNDSAGTIYLDDYGHQQILVAEVVTMSDESQKTKFGDSTQLDTLLSAGDLVFIDDLGADRNYTDAIQILEAIRDKVVAGGIDGEYLCTNATGDLVWGAGAIVIKEEGVVVSSNNCTAANFIGPAITAVDAGGGQVDITVVALQNVVEDTTPQLGGMLDVNGNSIGDGTFELIKFIETGSAVNEITITNAATGNGPIISATGDDSNVNLVLDTKGTGDIDASTNKIVNVVDPTADQDAATKKYVDDNASSPPTSLTDFHEVFRFYEQGSTGDAYLMRADSLVSNQFPGHIALANGQIVHATSAREKDATKFCDIVVRKQTASGTIWKDGTWTNVGTAVTMNNTILSDVFTGLTGYTFNAGDAIAVYLDKSTPVGGASCEDPFVALYIKYD